MNAVWVVLLATALRLVFANFTGLGIDESYMVAASDHFAASYFDHPLASWWLELGSRALFHSMAPLVVRLPFILLSAVSSWLIYKITLRLYGRSAAFWAVVAYNISPVFSLAFGSWVLPDGPLDAALLAAPMPCSRRWGSPPNRRRRSRAGGRRRVFRRAGAAQQIQRRLGAGRGGAGAAERPGLAPGIAAFCALGCCGAGGGHVHAGALVECHP